VQKILVINIISTIKFVYFISDVSNCLARGAELTNMIQPTCKRKGKHGMMNIFSMTTLAMSWAEFFLSKTFDNPLITVPSFLLNFEPKK
jgi:uncharacterized membrane protein